MMLHTHTETQNQLHSNAMFNTFGWMVILKLVNMSAAHFSFFWVKAMHLSQLKKELSFGDIFTFMPIFISCVAMANCTAKILQNISECKSVKNSFERYTISDWAKACEIKITSRRNVNNSRSRFKFKGETPINFLFQWKFPLHLFIFFYNLSIKIWMWQVSRNLFAVSYVYG